MGLDFESICVNCGRRGDLADVFYVYKKESVFLDDHDFVLFILLYNNLMLHDVLTDTICLIAEMTIFENTLCVCYLTG